MKLTKAKLQQIIGEELEQVEENWQAQQAETQCRLANSYGFTPDDDGWPGGLSYDTCQKVLGDQMSSKLTSWGEDRLDQAPERRSRRPRATPKLPALKDPEKMRGALSLSESSKIKLSKKQFQQIIKEEMDKILEYEDNDFPFDEYEELQKLKNRTSFFSILKELGEDGYAQLVELKREHDEMLNTVGEDEMTTDHQGDPQSVRWMESLKIRDLAKELFNQAGVTSFVNEKVVGFINRPHSVPSLEEIIGMKERYEELLSDFEITDDSDARDARYGRSSWMITHLPTGASIRKHNREGSLGS